MPRISKLNRLPRSSLSRKLTHSRQPNYGVVKSKTSHRFVRIHRKGKLEPTKTHTIDQATRSFTSQVAKPIYRNHKLLENNVHSNGEITMVPNPIPDTGFRPVLPSPTMHAIPLNRTRLPSATSALPTSVDPITFHRGPPPLTISSDSSYLGPEPLKTTNGATETHRHTQLSVPIIVLLAVGSGISLIIIFVLIKRHARPTRRPRPKPSLPILDDPFVDDKRFSLDDSPVFGGKERISTVGMWSWSQYPQPEIVVTQSDNNVKKDAMKEISSGYGATAYSSRQQGMGVPSVSDLQTQSQHGRRQSKSVPVTSVSSSQYRTSLQQVQRALSLAANRISAASTSLYASSPGKSQSRIGLAISPSPMTIFTADGSTLIKRTDIKATLNRGRLPTDTVTDKDLGSRHTRYSEESSYAISDIGSPSFLPYTSPPTNHPTRGGRSRIQSSYFTSGVYPRSSNTPLEAVKKPENSKPQHEIRSEPLKLSDAQALTNAPGLSSLNQNHAMPSPQPTLYPDDSLSVIGAKPSRKPRQSYIRKTLNKEKDDHTLPVISTAMDASAAVGSLMLLNSTTNAGQVGYGPIKSMSKATLSQSSAKEAGAVSAFANTDPVLKRSMSSQRSDKPPSIPLPAPLPSLAQMALEHTNAQAYADYRSPTYSIYGLYGVDRKSGGLM